MDKPTIFSCSVRGGTSVLALNSNNDRLIAAGQQSENLKIRFHFIFILFVK
jgi:hypothetical protein